MRSFDVIVVGELNVDLIMDGIKATPEEGKEVLADRMTLTLGSSSAIFACNLSSLGAKVAFAGKIGKDLFGDFMLNELTSKKVDVTLVKQDPQVKTGATVVLNYGKDRANITHQGAMSDFSERDISIDSIPEAKHLHFSSYFLQPLMQPYLPALFRAAKNKGMTTSLDVQWDPGENWQIDLAALLPWVDVFLPNETELLHLTRTSTVNEALQQLKGLANIIVVKRGARGSLCYANDNIREMPAFLNSAVVDAIGAGDSFNAGFIYQYIRGASLEACQEFGNLTGAISTKAAGGTTAFNDIKKHLKNAMEQYGILSA